MLGSHWLLHGDGDKLTDKTTEELPVACGHGIMCLFLLEELSDGQQLFQHVLLCSSLIAEGAEFVRMSITDLMQGSKVTGQISPKVLGTFREIRNIPQLIQKHDHPLFVVLDERIHPLHVWLLSTEFHQVGQVLHRLCYQGERSTRCGGRRVSNDVEHSGVENGRADEP